jgi:hypothetical protein
MCQPPLATGTRPHGWGELPEYPAASWDRRSPVASSMAAERKFHGDTNRQLFAEAV